MNKMQFPLVLGVSARHAHLCREHMNILFGEGSELHPKKYIGQPGQYSSEEQITLVTAKGEMKLRIIGPLRKYTQLELSFTDARKVGLNPPIRNSGDIKESAGGKLVGPKGEVEITEGVIIAARHIHLYPETAETYGLKDGDIVSIQTNGERALIMNNVLVRAGEGNADEVHIDTDEALSLIHISEPTRRVVISYAVFCLKKIFFNDTATTEIYTRLFVGSVRCV